MSGAISQVTEHLDRVIAERGNAPAYFYKGEEMSFAELGDQIRPGQDANSAVPKALLRANTEAAQAAGVFGVPAFAVDGKVFWGLDALPMLRAYLEGDAWFSGPDWDTDTPGESRRMSAAAGRERDRSSPSSNRVADTGESSAAGAQSGTY